MECKNGHHGFPIAPKQGEGNSVGGGRNRKVLTAAMNVPYSHKKNNNSNSDSSSRLWSFNEMTKLRTLGGSEDGAPGKLRYDSTAEHLWKMSVPGQPEDKKKMPAWIRSQLISANVTISTPFGLRKLIYADDVASGRSLHFIEDVMRTQVLPVYGNTHTEDSSVGEAMSRLVREATRFVRFCVGGESEDFSVFFVGTGSTGAVKKMQEMMGLAVSPIHRELILKTLPREERWIVFVGPYEHHSNLLSWQHSLAEVVSIPLDSKGLLDMDSLDKCLALEEYRGRPKLGSFSACSNVTGIITDTRAVARILHLHGALACFDFAASGPYVKIDMRQGKDDGYDAIFLSPHKFLGGPGSSGLLVMRKSIYQLSHQPPSTAGGGTVHYVNGNMKETVFLQDMEEREDPGTPGITQRIRTGLAFYLKEVSGVEEMERRECELTRQMMRRLSSNPRIVILGNGEAPRLPILSFLIRPCSSEPVSGQNVLTNLSRKGPEVLHFRFVVKLLNDLFGIQARGGCACAGPYGHFLLGIDRTTSLAIIDALAKGYEAVKPGWVRVNFAHFASPDEFDFIISAIEFVAEHGLQFLPLYDLDWSSGKWACRADISRATEAWASETKARRDGSSLMFKLLLACMRCTTGAQGKVEDEEATEFHLSHFGRCVRNAKRILATFSSSSYRTMPIPDDLHVSLVTFLT